MDKKKNTLYFVIALVMIGHSIVFYHFFIKPPLNMPLKLNRKKIYVNHITISPQKIIAVNKKSEPSQEVQKKPPPRAIQKQPSKNTTLKDQQLEPKKTSQIAKPNPLPKTSVKSPPSKAKELNKIKDKILSLNTEKTKSSNIEITLPKIEFDMSQTIEPLQNSVDEASYDFSYQDILVSSLQYFLKLPERGEVKVSLTLDKKGLLKKYSIIQSSSLVNKKYIEENLTKVDFPVFTSDFINVDEYTFNLTLSSEI